MTFLAVILLDPYLMLICLDASSDLKIADLFSLLGSGFPMRFTSLMQKLRNLC